MQNSLFNILIQLNYTHSKWVMLTLSKRTQAQTLTMWASERVSLWVCLLKLVIIPGTVFINLCCLYWLLRTKSTFNYTFSLLKHIKREFEWWTKATRYRNIIKIAPIMLFQCNGMPFVYSRLEVEPQIKLRQKHRFSFFLWTKQQFKGVAVIQSSYFFSFWIIRRDKKQQEKQKANSLKKDNKENI